jgi:hypothetical protein
MLSMYLALNLSKSVIAINQPLRHWNLKVSPALHNMNFKYMKSFLSIQTAATKYCWE